MIHRFGWLPVFLTLPINVNKRLFLLSVRWPTTLLSALHVCLWWREQKTRLVGPARLTAWRLSNELRSVLKELLLEADGVFASLSWVPDGPFTRLLQVGVCLGRTVI